VISPAEAPMDSIAIAGSDNKEFQILFANIACPPLFSACGLREVAH